MSACLLPLCGLGPVNQVCPAVLNPLLVQLTKMPLQQGQFGPPQPAYNPGNPYGNNSYQQQQPQQQPGPQVVYVYVSTHADRAG